MDTQEQAKNKTKNHRRGTWIRRGQCCLGSREGRAQTQGSAASGCEGVGRSVRD